MDDEDVISRYTRENAIDDGVLVDVTGQAKVTGIRVPTVITSHLHQVLEDIPESSAGQDYRGRLHDVLWMTFLKLRAMQVNRSDDFPALVDVIIDSKKQTLWAIVDGGDLTIMFPEDY
jgi:hypothetical protein